LIEIVLTWPLNQTTDIFSFC